MAKNDEKQKKQKRSAIEKLAGAAVALWHLTGFIGGIGLTGFIGGIGLIEFIGFIAERI